MWSCGSLASSSSTQAWSFQSVKLTTTTSRTLTHSIRHSRPSPWFDGHKSTEGQCWTSSIEQWRRYGLLDALPWSIKHDDATWTEQSTVKTTERDARCLHGQRRDDGEQLRWSGDETRARDADGEMKKKAKRQTRFGSKRGRRKIAFSFWDFSV